MTEHSHRKTQRLLSLFLGLGISMTALGALAYRAQAEHLSKAFLIHEPMKNAAPVAETAPAPSAEATAKPALPSVPDLAATVEVPTFRGKRLSKARKEARALGLKVVARDADGYRVRADEAQYYRVTGQDTAEGSRVPPGAPIEVRVREVNPGFASGY